MFENPGSKVKSIAVIWFWLIAIGSFIVGIIIMLDTDGLIGASILFGGILFGYLSALGLYAFGELVENSTETRKQVENLQINANAKVTEVKELSDELPEI